MKRVYAMVGPVSGELLSHEGRVICHDNRRELEWLFPQVRVVEVPRAGLGRPLMSLRNHPDMQGVTWPLNPDEFRR